MAFQSSVTDKEVEDYLHENVGDFRPDWQSLYFDLVGMGAEFGMMSQISKTEGVKQLSKGLKKYLQPSDAMTRKAFMKYGGSAEEVIPQVTRKLTPEQKTAFRAMTRGVRQASEKFLNPVSKLELHPRVYVRSEYPGESINEIFGSYNRGTDKIELNFEALAKRSKRDPGKAKNTLFHEMGHAMQKETGISDSFVSSSAREMHMQLFADDLERISQKGGKLSDELIEDIFADTWDKTQQLKAGGVGTRDLANRIHNQRMNDFNLREMNPDFDTSYKASDEMMRYFEADVVDFIGEFKSSFGKHDYELTKYKVGDMIDVPGVGKVKYDAAMEPFEGKGLLHQYTIQEGPAKGATIGSYKEGFDELIKIASEKTKQFAEGMKFKLEDFDF